MTGKIYTLEEVEGLSAKEKIKLTAQFVNPGMVKIFKMLGFEKLWASSAEGMYITLSDGRKILDMTGGNCVLGLGHNHPRILAARIRFAQEKRLEICKSFISPYVAVLAANMAEILPQDLDYSFFCGSGAEAVEGALKLAQKHHGRERLGIVYTDKSFHGKSHAAMSVSSLDDSRENFQLLDKCYKVAYGDAQSLEELFISRCKEGANKPDICAFILEAIHGTHLVFPPQGYLRRVRDLCDKYDVLMVVDEIYTGFGRTGYWFAFESEGVVPDIVCYSKTLGGGKASIGGYTARRKVFLKAYGKPEDSMMHSSTFSGMSEECATAIEAINIIKDEDLVRRSMELGGYLGRRCGELKDNHPKVIKDVRGRGLLWGIEVTPLFDKVNPVFKNILPEDTQLLPKLTGAIVLSELLHTYGILAYLGFTRRNLIVLSPSLLVNRGEIDKTIDSLDKIFSEGLFNLAKRFLARAITS